jgi:hypothetical protein
MSSLSSSTEVKGGALGWAMLNGINSCLGVTSALLVNVSLNGSVSIVANFEGKLTNNTAT